MHVLRGVHDARSNAAMVEDLQRSRVLKSPACVAAFRAVDRGDFLCETGFDVTYADMPLRHGRLHQSAPHIYARALETLMPQTNMSFLNVGSGTGYFNSLVAELAGGNAINDGIDIWPELVAHASERCSRRGRHNIVFSLGNVLHLNVDLGSRYDRIYMGACGESRSQNLYRMLQVGGILVGPFQLGPMQQLLRVERLSETEFSTEILGSVQFSSLVEPPSPCTSSPDHAALPIVLRELPWTFARGPAYPAPFRAAAAVLLHGGPQDPSFPRLPSEVWAHVLSYCGHRWFEAPLPSPQSSVRKAIDIANRAAKCVSCAVRRTRSSSEVSESMSTEAPSPSSRSDSFSSSESEGEQRSESALSAAVLDAPSLPLREPFLVVPGSRSVARGSCLLRAFATLRCFAGRHGMRLFACRRRATCMLGRRDSTGMST